MIPGMAACLSRPALPWPLEASLSASGETTACMTSKIGSELDMMGHGAMEVA